MRKNGARKLAREPRPVVVLDASATVRAAVDAQLTTDGYEVITTGDATRLRALVLACDPCLVVCEWTGAFDPGAAACPVIVLVPARGGPKKGQAIDGAAGRVDKPLRGPRLAQEV